MRLERGLFMACLSLLMAGCGVEPVAVQMPDQISLLVEGENPYVGDSVLAVFNRGLEYKLATSGTTAQLFAAYVDSSVTYALQTYALGPESSGSFRSSGQTVQSGGVRDLLGSGMIAAPTLEDRGITSLRDYFIRGSDGAGGYSWNEPPSCADLRLAVQASNRAVSRVSPEARARLGSAGWGAFVGAIGDATWAAQTGQRANARGTVYTILFGVTADNANFAMDAGKTVIQNSFVKAFYAQCPTY